MAVHLVWFRNDLRINDNMALYHACTDPNALVIAVYIATPKQWHKHNLSARQAWFIYQHLQSLNDQLAELNIPLIYKEVALFEDSIPVVLSLCQQYKVTDVYFNRQYEFNEQQRDNNLKNQLSLYNICCHHYDDSVLLPPGKVVTSSGNMYQVFTPFGQRYQKYFLQHSITVLPKPNKRCKSPLSKHHAKQIRSFNYPMLSSTFFAIGEKQAINLLDKFCEQSVENYLAFRDIMSIKGTSQLSAYLTVGILSPRQCLSNLLSKHPNLLHFSQSGAYGWFSQLVWREFYRHLLVAYPKLSKNLPFIDWTRRIIWRNNEADFLAWQKGLTGFPIVDAAMRQLNSTGWMHNRLRLITASFLVKDLLIDWRQGESFFMSQLIDGDLAANNGGWQWSASTGTDAAPYFRIFNPTTQGERFDPQGKFIRQYLPELADVPDKFIHQPHKWAEQQHLNLDYPKPIVDHKQARLQTLTAFDMAKLTS